MEGGDLERALERERQKLSRDILKPVEIRSLGDIKRVVSELDPHRNPPQMDITISTLMDVAEDAGHATYRVSAPTRSKSKRDILIEGLEIVKTRLAVAERLQVEGEPVEVNGVKMRPALVGNGVQGQLWVDLLIRQWLGGYRDGTLICWNLNDGYIYRYDIFTHRLTRAEESH